MAVTVTHSKTLIAPDSGIEDKVYGSDYVSATSHIVTGLDIALSWLAPTADETITADYSAVVVRKFTIASGKKLILASGSRFRVL